MFSSIRACPESHERVVLRAEQIEGAIGPLNKENHLKLGQISRGAQTNVARQTAGPAKR